MINKDLIPIDLYKDPLKKNEGGFGFLGCMLQTRGEDKLQCHVCGKLFESLSGHIQKHQLTTKEYRNKFGLAYNTSMNSRVLRERKMSTFLKYPKETRDKWRDNAIAALAKARAEGKDMIRDKNGKRIGHKSTLESLNKKGNCPDQILEEIKRFYENHKKVPTQREFTVKYPMGSRYVALAIRTFGSWTKALEMCGFEKNKTGSKPGGKKIRYETNTLKEILLNFAKENNRIPRHSDFLIGELPSVSVYRTRFGGLEKARVASGVYDYF